MEQKYTVSLNFCAQIKIIDDFVTLSSFECNKDILSTFLILCFILMIFENQGDNIFTVIQIAITFENLEAKTGTTYCK